jgi:predicted phage baseplate assembly protein
MDTNDLTKLNDCGCCEGLTCETPLGIDNRPGLSAIGYRVGTHSRFKASMLARLSDSDLSALKALTTRKDDDFSIALLDAFASVADVLTFYQERIANENYLRTATERNSILQVARLIGYKLRPGVAASVYLAFTLEDAPGAPRRATLPIGAKVQSVPGPGEQPQTFETIEQIDARAEWNAMKPRLTKPQLISTGMDSILLKGTATKLAKGDALLIIAPDSSGTVDKKLRRVETVQEDHVKQQTAVTLVPLPRFVFVPFGGGALMAGQFASTTLAFNNTTIQDQVLNQSWNTSDLDAFARVQGFSIDQMYQVIASRYSISPPPPNTAIFAMRKRAALFGYNAPPWQAMADSVKAGYLAQGLYAEYFDNVDLTSRRVTRIDPQLNFDWGSGSPDPAIPPDAFSARWTGLVKPPATGAFTFYTRSDDGVRLWVDDQLIIDHWTDHGETEDNGTIQLEGGRLYSIRLEYYERAGSAVIKLFWSGPSQPKEIIPSNRLYLTDPGEWPLPNFNTAITLYLDQVYKSIKPGDWVVVQRPNKADVIAQVKNVQETAAAYFAISGQMTAISFDANDPSLDMTLETMDELRQTCVYIIPEELPADDLPDTIDVQASPIQLDGPVPWLTSGQTILISGTRADADGVTNAESAVISEVTLDGGYTTLQLTNDLSHPYVRDTVSINGNAALATNGETKTEVLGGGDASQAYQQFVLKQSPLTYTSAPTASGAESTLKVYVNEVQWHEQPALYGAGARDRIFATQLSDDGKTTVEFGDGQSGARLPTGRENIKATYRQGIGTGGDVKAGQLSLLMAAPLGVKSVTNPQPASGGADSEKLDDARTNAPITVLTLDRVVSLTDYEDFARAFAGIAKALATWTWDGQTRGVFVTVAGPNGAEIPDGSKTLTNLVAAMQSAGDPHVPLRVQTYRSAFFRLSALVNINPDYQQDKVMGALTNALRAAFSFDARGFGQGVALSQVVAGMQAVPGVDAVDVTKLYRVGDAAEWNARLPAAMPQAGAEGTVQAAELLILDPGPTDLGVMS